MEWERKDSHFETKEETHRNIAVLIWGMAPRFDTWLGYWMVLPGEVNFINGALWLSILFWPCRSKQTRNCGKGGVYIRWLVGKVDGGTTMTEVNLWLLTMLEQDIPVPSPYYSSNEWKGAIAQTSYALHGVLYTVHVWAVPHHIFLQVSLHNVGMMEHSPIMVKTNTLMEDKPEDTPAMPISPKPLHSTARAETAMSIASSQITAATMPSKHEKEPQQQAFTFAHTTPNLLMSHPWNSPISLVGDNRATKATPPDRVSP